VTTTLEYETPLDLRVSAATSRTRHVGVAKVPAKIVPAAAPAGEFKDWLADRMEAVGLSQAELSRRSGVNNSTINNLLKARKGSGQPGLEVLRMLAKGLEMPLAELLVIAGRIDPGEWEGSSVPLPPEVQQIMARLSYQSELKNRAMLNMIPTMLVILDQVEEDIEDSPAESKRRNR
jgi:transcriptional regulator with XRE-family HTH domain